MTIGTLFTEDFLAEGIRQSTSWQDLPDAEVATARDAISNIFASVANLKSQNEAQTQHHIIEPILAALGWSGAWNIQTNIENKGRAHVPDYSFFSDPEAFAKADQASSFDAKLKHAVAVGDAKQWSIGWVASSALPTPNPAWNIGFKEITAPSNERTMIAAVMPGVAFGNNSLPFDYVTRQKVHGQTLNWFLVEQLPVIPYSDYKRTFGQTTAEDLVKDHVLRLTYTAHDMAPFARDMGYDGQPFAWDEDERRHLGARLDALYFHLYGITDEADIRYILSTFPIVERKDRAAWSGVYLTAELIIWYLRALAAGDATSLAPEALLIRQAVRSI